MTTTQTTDGSIIGVGDYVRDGNAEAQIVDISMDGVEVQIEYTDTHNRVWIQGNRFQEQNGELRVC